MSNPIASRRSDRLVGAVLALAVQVLLIGLLILPHSPPASVVKAARELIFILPLLEKAPPPKPAPVRTSSPSPTLSVPVVPPMAPAINSNPVPAAPSPDQLRALGQGIFGCAPESWSSLTPQQRALCQRPGEGVAIQNAPNLVGAPDHVKDEAHWEEEWAREKSPILLPCGGFINVICLLKKIADGSLSDYGDPSTWPHYAVQQLPKNELYKIEQAYEAWHKAHPTKADTALPATPSDTAASAKRVSVHPQ